jgi:hypothetical protein
LQEENKYKLIYHKTLINPKPEEVESTIEEGLNLAYVYYGTAHALSQPQPREKPQIQNTQPNISLNVNAPIVSAVGSTAQTTDKSVFSPQPEGSQQKKEKGLDIIDYALLGTSFVPALGLPSGILFDIKQGYPWWAAIPANIAGDIAGAGAGIVAAPLAPLTYGASEIAAVVGGQIAGQTLTYQILGVGGVENG